MQRTEKRQCVVIRFESAEVVRILKNELGDVLVAWEYQEIREWEIELGVESEQSKNVGWISRDRNSRDLERYQNDWRKE